MTTYLFIHEHHLKVARLFMHMAKLQVHTEKKEKSKRGASAIKEKKHKQQQQLQSTVKKKKEKLQASMFLCYRQ